MPIPDLLELPLCLNRAVGYRAISAQVTARYERANYFSGVLTGAPVDPKTYASQFFPYPVRDVYGTAVIPETLGNVSPPRDNQNEPRPPQEVPDSARRQLLLRARV